MSDHDNSDILGPQCVRNMIGQRGPRRKLQTMAESARGRGLAMRHVALVGPGGTGKTHLARMVGALMDADCTEFTAGAVRGIGEMTDMLRAVKPYEIIFIDEFHRVAPMTCDQVLFPALSDRVIYIKSDTTPIKHSLPPFTLIAATTDAKFNPSMARRFTRIDLDYYSDHELTEILIRAARGQEPDAFEITRDAAQYLAQRSQGVAGVAEQLLTDAIDETRGDTVITLAHAVAAMALAGIDALGLGKQERKILDTVMREAGRPIGLASIKAVTGMREIEEQVNFLTRVGLVRLHPGRQGRVATVKAYHEYDPDGLVPPMVAGIEPGAAT